MFDLRQSGIRERVGMRLALVLVIGAMWALSNGAAATERLALVIGNAAYANVGELRNPANDANLVSTALKRLGFTVHDHRNLDSSGLEEAMISFAEAAAQAGSDALILFFYAGHGVQIADENFLMPVDANPSTALRLRSQAYSLNDYLLNIANAEVKYSIVILDACRNNPFVTDSRATTRGLARVEEESATDVQTYIMFSTGPGQVAADGGGANSDFSAALASNLVADVTIDDIGAAVSVAVYDKTGQKPWISDGMPHNPVLSTGAPPPDEPATAVTPEGTAPDAAAAPREAATANESSSDTEADLAFQDALREDTLEGYRKFLERYPNHPRRQLILDFYERIADEEMWRKVLQENTLGGYARYIDAYPDGIYVELARQKQEELRAPAEEQVATREGETVEPEEPEESSFILYRGYDFAGSDLLWLEDETLEGCEESCRDDGSCRAFTFNVEKRVCILKSGYGRPTPHEEAISGAYADGPPVDLPSPSPVREFTYYEGIDLSGDDLGDWIEEQTLDGCAELCRINNACSAFTFNVQQNVCILKSGYGRPENHRYAISGAYADGPPVSVPGVAQLDVKPGIDYEGGDYDDRRNVTLDECYSLCANDSRCVAFSYSSDLDWCWMKSSLSPPRSDPDIVSGVKY